MFKCWIKSFFVTAIIVILEWLIVEFVTNGTMVILTAYLGAIIAETISLFITIKIKEKKYKKLILSLLLPSNYYLIFILGITYWLFFTEWSLRFDL